MLTCGVFVQPSAGPAKKSKTASAAAGKPKKAADSKDVTESELAVSVFHTCTASFNPPTEMAGTHLSLPKAPFAACLAEESTSTSWG